MFEQNCRDFTIWYICTSCHRAFTQPDKLIDHKIKSHKFLQNRFSSVFPIPSPSKTKSKYSLSPSSSSSEPTLKLNQANHLKHKGGDDTLCRNQVQNRSVCPTLLNKTKKPNPHSKTTFKITHLTSLKMIIHICREKTRKTSAVLTTEPNQHETPVATHSEVAEPD